MGEWKSLKIDDGTGWKEIYREAGSGWKELTWESAAIDVGSACSNRALTVGSGYTRMVILNPANLTGTLTNVCIFVNSAISGLKIGIFEHVSSNDYKCTAVHTEGNAGTGEQNIAVSMAINAGDLIGCYFTGGAYDRDSGGNGYKWAAGDKIILNATNTFSIASNNTISLYGTG